MAARVFMPKAGMAMEEGTIVQWFYQEGDRVEAGEPLLEIETDKVNMEVESPATGILLKIVQPAGNTVLVTKTIGWVGDAGEIIEKDETDKSAPDSSESTPGKEKAGTTEEPVAAALHSEGARIPATPLARRLAAEKGIKLEEVSPSGSSGEVKARDIEAVQNINATPLARKMAEDLNLDLAALKGTGARGKIMEADVLASSAMLSLRSASTKVTEKTVRKPMSGMRKVIAKRMLESHRCVPPVTQLAKADVTELLEVRKNLCEALGINISLNDILLKVTAIVLNEYPALNISIDGYHIIQHPHVNLGMAVALEEGLIVPVIRNADKLSLKEISITAKTLAEKARSGRLKPDDYVGGTFTVSNMGSFGIYSFTPIINQPESAILGVCAIEDHLMLEDEEVVVHKILGLCLTFDHRAIDGAQCAIFQSKIKYILENPHILMTY